MSRLSSLQRKAALLRFYLQQQDGAYPNNVKERIALLDMTRAGFERWIKGEVLKPQRLDAINHSILDALGLDPNAEKLFDEAFGVMRLGKLLGLSRRDCQLAIDQVAGELGPTFSTFSMPQQKARKVLSLLQGLYCIYRLEATVQSQTITGRARSILRLGLSVRYALPGSKALSQQERRIRCKLSIPSYRLTGDFHEYDGYVTDTDSAGRHYWMFETRAEINRDVVFLMTEVLRRGPQGVSDRQIANGVMISRTQDATSIPAIWPIVMVKEPERIEDAADFEDTTEKRFLREHILRKERLPDQYGLDDPLQVEPWICAALAEAERFAQFYRLDPPA